MLSTMANILHAERKHNVSRMAFLPQAAECLLCSMLLGVFVIFLVFILVLAVLPTALLAF